MMKDGSCEEARSLRPCLLSNGRLVDAYIHLDSNIWRPNKQTLNWHWRKRRLLDKIYGLCMDSWGLVMTDEVDGPLSGHTHSIFIP